MAISYVYNPFTDELDAVDISAGASTGSIVEYSIGNSSGAVTINWNSGAFQSTILTGSSTYTFTNPTDAGLYILRTKQGAGPFKITWPGSVFFPAGIVPIPSQVSSGLDVYTFYFDGAKYNNIGVSFEVS